MSIPLYWIVYVTPKHGDKFEQRFTERSRARGFALIQKSLGHAVDTKAVGY